MSSHNNDGDGGAGPASDRVRVRRRAERASYDDEVVRAIIDEALMCRVAFVDDGHPFVLPMLHVRIGDRLFFHGSLANRTLNLMRDGVPMCIEATIVDSIVMSRSVLQHAMNYRSVIVLGQGHEVVDLDEKRSVLHALLDRIVPGRGPELRPLTEAELRSTRVVAMPLAECSAKVRTGPPVEQDGDYAWPAWAGELPLRIAAGPPIPDPQLAPDVAAPSYLDTWRADRHGI